ncbi:MAG TPA: hypothetical protein VF101_06800, partial [Gaiellaceae bacterium]
PSDVLVARFDGFGAQYNQNLFAARSQQTGVTAAGIQTMTPKLAALGPQMARLFFNPDAVDDPDLLNSFRKSVQLAQDTLADGGTINITLQALGPNVIKKHPTAVKDFAAELVRQVRDAHIDKLRWVTLRNEPNGSSPMDKNDYANAYREIDGQLRADGVRPPLQIMAGDLLLNNQLDWFQFIGKNMANIVDAYSIHVYWDYRSPTKIDDRILGVRDIVNGLGDAKKPLYVMEYGARGDKAPDGSEPGNTAAGDPVVDTNLNAFQRAWFALQAVKKGFRGTVAWDAYFAKYDATPQDYSLIGPPDDWTRRPAFRALRLLIKAVRPGWKGVNVVGVSDTERIVGFTDGHDVTVAGLDIGGAQQDSGSSASRSYTIGGLPGNTSFGLWFWNRDGDGMNSFDGRVQSDGGGNVSFEAPLRSVFVVTTLPPPA